MHRTRVRIVEDALDANNTIARSNRADFDHAGVTVVNLMSAPGAGKTTLLDRVGGALHGDWAGALAGLRVAVLEGAGQGSFDADRLARWPGRVLQLNTGAAVGAPACLDADM